MRWLFIARLTWTLLFLVWSTYLLMFAPEVPATSVLVLTAMEIDWYTVQELARIPELWYATRVAFFNLAMYTGKLCMAGTFPGSAATTSAFITGTRESVSCFFRRVRSQMRTCYSLARSYAKAQTASSIKTESERYSDL